MDLQRWNISREMTRYLNSQFHSSKSEMATMSAKAERYIGTQGGGMDQAIAFLGKAGETIYTPS